MTRPTAITGTWSDLESHALYVYEFRDRDTAEWMLAEAVLVLRADIERFRRAVADAERIIEAHSGRGSWVGSLLLDREPEGTRAKRNLARLVSGARDRARHAMEFPHDHSVGRYLCLADDVVDLVAALEDSESREL